MTVNEVMASLEEMGNPNTKKVLMKHGAKEPFFGVKVGDMKKIQKKVKKDHALALELYNSGNSDAMYLAGLIADEKAVTKKELKDWAKNAYWYMLSEYTVAWLASESQYGWELGLEWIESKDDKIASCGWATLSNYVALQADEDLDTKLISKLLDRIESDIHSSQNRERYCMNNFVISAGTYVIQFTDKCLALGDKIGKVSVEMGGTSCNVPLIKPYLQNIIDKDRLGKKKKMARC